MFNETIKNNFLSNAERKESYTELFEKTAAKENELSKDLFDFKKSELVSMTEDKRELVLIRNYIDWCICQGHAGANINPLHI